MNEHDIGLVNGLWYFWLLSTLRYAYAAYSNQKMKNVTHVSKALIKSGVMLLGLHPRMPRIFSACAVGVGPCLIAAMYIMTGAELFLFTRTCMLISIYYIIFYSANREAAKPQLKVVKNKEDRGTGT